MHTAIALFLLLAGLENLSWGLLTGLCIRYRALFLQAAVWARK